MASMKKRRKNSKSPHPRTRIAPVSTVLHFGQGVLHRLHQTGPLRSAESAQLDAAVMLFFQASNGGGRAAVQPAAVFDVDGPWCRRFRRLRDDRFGQYGDDTN